MEKEWFYDRRFSKTYIFKYSRKFLKDYGLTSKNLQDDILHYLEYHYFIRQEKYFKATLTKWKSIWYHKIETTVGEQGRRSGGRTLAFFIIHNENEKAYIIPAFFFSVQEEKTYTTNILTSPQFGKKLKQKLEGFSPDDMEETVIWTPPK